MTTVATSRPSTIERSRRADLVVLGAVTILVRLPAYLADRHLTFDDGVYGASAVAMRAGGQPFRDVFSSQGPLFLPVVWAADGLGLRSANAPRLLSLLAALVLVTATYLAGRTISDRTGALLGAALVSVTGSILWVTAPIAADGVSLALATATVALALRWRHGPTTRQALWLGLGVGATVSVKALLVPVVVPIALVLLAARRFAPVAAAAMTAVGFHLALWLPWGPGQVWEQTYGYHLEVAGERTPGRNLLKVASTLGDRDALILAALALVVGGLVVGHRRSPRPHEQHFPTPDTVLLAWLVATVMVLLVEHPLWRPHVSQLVPVSALLAARHRPPVRALALAAVLVVPYHLVHSWPILHPAPYSDSSKRALEALRALPEGALAISDDPGLVWRAGRRTPPDLVDASALRIESGNLTATSIAKTAARPEVCAVVVRSRDRWGSFPDLPERLARAGYEVTDDDGGARRLYLVPDCEPG